MPVKYTEDISQNYVALSEYVNFKRHRNFMINQVWIVFVQAKIFWNIKFEVNDSNSNFVFPK